MWCGERLTGGRRRRWLWGGSILAALGCLLAFGLPPPARAAVYRYVSEDGSESFTDCPVEEGGRLIVRDAPAGVRKEATRPRRDGVAGRRLLSALGSGTEALPVDGIITSPYGLRHDPIDGVLRLHQGIDIAVPEGTPVHPVAPGRVAFSGPRSGYGNAVVVDHGDGRVTLYGHNQANWVKEGDAVTPADILALSGSTGRSTGPHVHFALWRDGVNDTESFLRGLGGDGAEGGPAGGPAGEDVIRRIIQADGSTLYTNLPPGVP
jgi:murein DD-endopeptidase MepM/ murein hydrolase activator NlpD